MREAGECDAPTCELTRTRADVGVGVVVTRGAVVTRSTDAGVNRATLSARPPCTPPPRRLSW